MTGNPCPRELDVTRAVLARRRGCHEEETALLEHARECPACSAAATLAAAFGESCDQALHEARVPAAGQVWWRAALRAHADAERAARRPFVWLLGISAACTAALGAALLQALWPRLSETARSLAEIELPGVVSSPWLSSFSLIVLGCLLVAPVLVYFALSDGSD